MESIPVSSSKRSHLVTPVDGDHTQKLSAQARCCATCDTSAGLAKYYSIDHLHNMCGECCMKPSQFWLYKIFEPGLTKATDANPCDGFGYPTYDDTVTHGFGPVKM